MESGEKVGILHSFFFFLVNKGCVSKFILLKTVKRAGQTYPPKIAAGRGLGKMRNAEIKGWTGCFNLGLSRKCDSDPFYLFHSIRGSASLTKVRSRWAITINIYGEVEWEIKSLAKWSPATFFGSCFAWFVLVGACGDRSDFSFGPLRPRVMARRGHSLDADRPSRRRRWKKTTTPKNDADSGDRESP